MILSDSKVYGFLGKEKIILKWNINIDKDWFNFSEIFIFLTILNTLFK